jgi:hypothetical protein
MNSYKPMTRDELVDIFNNAESEFKDGNEAIQQAVLARIAEQGLVIVPVADCPNCNNDGAYYDNYGQVHQCQWCYEMPHSRFNQKQANPEATKDGA